MKLHGWKSRLLGAFACVIVSVGTLSAGESGVPCFVCDGYNLYPYTPDRCTELSWEINIIQFGKRGCHQTIENNEVTSCWTDGQPCSTGTILGFEGSVAGYQLAASGALEVIRPCGGSFGIIAADGGRQSLHILAL